MFRHGIAAKMTSALLSRRRFLLETTQRNVNLRKFLTIEFQDYTYLFTYLLTYLITALNKLCRKRVFLLLLLVVWHVVLFVFFGKLLLVN